MFSGKPQTRAVIFDPHKSKVKKPNKNIIAIVVKI